MVGITYTDINGKSHGFDASSPLMAMQRLSRIPGYHITEAEKVAATAATSLRQRRKQKAAAFANDGGVPVGNAAFAINRGLVGGSGTSGIEVALGDEVKDGVSVAKRYQEILVSENGKVSVGKSRRVPITEENRTRLAGLKESASKDVEVVAGDGIDVKESSFGSGKVFKVSLANQQTQKDINIVAGNDTNLVVTKNETNDAITFTIDVYYR